MIYLYIYIYILLYMYTHRHKTRVYPQEQDYNSGFIDHVPTGMHIEVLETANDAKKRNTHWKSEVAW